MTVQHKHHLLLASLLLPVTAIAHPGGEAHGFLQGAMHPLSGVDHVLAMLAVGLLAGRMGGRAVWMLPASFLAMMIAGGAIEARGIHLPFVEAAIALSLVASGAALVTRNRLAVTTAGALAGCFAVFHGYAHGAEMGGDISGLTYGAGFVLATTVLHGSGLSIALAVGTANAAAERALRAGGGAITAVGATLLGAVLI